jgi:hypothetical protein
MGVVSSQPVHLGNSEFPLETVHCGGLNDLPQQIPEAIVLLYKPGFSPNLSASSIDGLGGAFQA